MALVKIKQLFSYLFTFLSAVLLYFVIHLVIHIIHLGEISKEYKNDYSHLHSVEYGLFNSTIWADKVATIVDIKIDEFDFTATSREEIKKYAETILDTLIIEADKAVRERNKGKGGWWKSLVGNAKQSIADSLFNVRSLRNKVPEFTNAIMDELEKPVNQKILKKVMR